MADWPVYSLGHSYVPSYGHSHVSIGALGFSTLKNNAKGAWNEIVASTPYPVRMITLTLANGGYDMLLDIGVGAAGSEVVLVSDLILSEVNAIFVAMQTVQIPVRIPAGTRIAMRGQVNSTSDRSVYVNMHLSTTCWPHHADLIPASTYGAATADSGGTSIDPGGTVNTEGAWVELSAACAEHIRGLILGVGCGGNFSRVLTGWLVDIGVGAAASEVVLVPDVYINNVNNAVVPFYTGPIPVDVPAGTRIAIRAQCSINDASDRLFDAVLYALT
jgi:hypothetical protein